MTSSNSNNDLVPSQEKLEWVTPKISLMETDDTEGEKFTFASETESGGFPPLGVS